MIRGELHRHLASSILLVILVVLAAGSTDSGTKSSGGSGQLSTTRPPLVPGEQWSYDQTPDEMAKGSIYTASVTSTNTVDFDFPYSGEQHAILTLRTHPRYGKDAYLRMERGQFLCNSYEGCNVLVRFDDGEAQTLSAGEPADNSSETLFIRNYSRLVAGILKANRVRISAQVYQEGSPVFEFDVRGFDAARYKPPQ